MENHHIEVPVNPLVDFKKGELEKHDAFEVLANVRSENRWLANFSVRGQSISES